LFFLGDIAFRFLKYTNIARSSAPSLNNQETWVTVCDINKNMLEVGKEKAKKLNFVTGIRNLLFYNIIQYHPILDLQNTSILY